MNPGFFAWQWSMAETAGFLKRRFRDGCSSRLLREYFNKNKLFAKNSLTDNSQNGKLFQTDQRERFILKHEKFIF